MTGRDAARDELITTLRGTTIRILPDRTLDLVADALLARGYRRSVTPDEVEKARREIAKNHLRRYDSEYDASRMSWHNFESEADEDMRAAARTFGLEVTE